MEEPERRWPIFSVSRSYVSSAELVQPARTDLSLDQTLDTGIEWNFESNGPIGSEMYYQCRLVREARSDDHNCDAFSRRIPDFISSQNLQSKIGTVAAAVKNANAYTHTTGTRGNRPARQL
jgi:hypothetical protein